LQVFTFPTFTEAKLGGSPNKVYPVVRSGTLVCAEFYAHGCMRHFKVLDNSISSRMFC